MKPQPVLSDMPRHIKQRIVQYVNPVSRFTLRQCSKDLKTITETLTPVHFDSLVINLNSTIAVISISHYAARRTFNRTMIEAGDLIKRVVEHLMNMFKSRMLSVKVLSVQLSYKNQQFITTLSNSLLELEYKLPVRKITIFGNAEEPVLDLILQLQPDVLEAIDLRNRVISRAALEQLVESEQWKQAKKLQIERPLPWLQVSMWRNFEIVSVKVGHLSLEIVQGSVQAFLQNPRAVKWNLHNTSYDLDSIHGYLDQFQHDRQYFYIVFREENKFVRIAWSQSSFQLVKADLPRRR